MEYKIPLSIGLLMIVHPAFYMAQIPLYRTAHTKDMHQWRQF